MTREQNIQLIRERAVEANPEIRGRWGIDDTPPIERGVRLSDVLLAMEGKPAYDRVVVTTSGHIMDFEGVVPPNAKWNFRKDDLTQQSDETISFLAELLKD